jgi:membrane protein DedA with SNARE-associated domain
MDLEAIKAGILSALPAGIELEPIKASVIGFVETNQGWAPVIVAALAFGESIAILSFFVPATVILVGVGALIGVTGLEFWPIWSGAAAGAVLGDAVSYWVGRRFERATLASWPLNRHPAMVERGERFFHRFGPWAVFIGRFFGPARAGVPLIAGIFAMPAILFFLATVVSALVWAFFLLAPGAGLLGYLGS